MITDGRWPEGYGGYVSQLSKNSSVACGWEKAYEERRNCSQEERVMRQVSIERQWKGTMMERIWGKIREFASPADNFQMGRVALLSFARQAGITSVRLRDQIATLFLEELSKYNAANEHRASINAMHLCKSLEMSLTNSGFRGVLASHCFADTLSLVGLNAEDPGTIHRDAIAACVQGFVEGAIPSTEEQRECQLRTVERLMAMEDAMETHECDSLDLSRFTVVLFSPKSSYLLSTFLKHILEVCSRQLRPPFGAFPTLPLRWVTQTALVPYDLSTPGDADALLLREFEQGPRSQTLLGGKRKKG